MVSLLPDERHQRRRGRIEVGFEGFSEGHCLHHGVRDVEFGTRVVGEKEAASAAQRRNSYSRTRGYATKLLGFSGKHRPGISNIQYGEAPHALPARQQQPDVQHHLHLQRRRLRDDRPVHGGNTALHRPPAGAAVFSSPRAAPSPVLPRTALAVHAFVRRFSGGRSCRTAWRSSVARWCGASSRADCSGHRPRARRGLRG